MATDSSLCVFEYMFIMIFFNVIFILMMVLSFPSHYFFRSVHFKACFFFFYQYNYTRASNRLVLWNNENTHIWKCSGHRRKLSAKIQILVCDVSPFTSCLILKHKFLEFLNLQELYFIKWSCKMFSIHDELW